MRWGAPGDRTQCGTDATAPTLAEDGKIRGYCCVKESAATIREAIVSGQTDPVTIGQPVEMDNGAKDTEMTTIAQRVNLDSDTTSADYTSYVSNGKGNGMRMVMVPINGGPPNYIAIGFAGFFLLSPWDYNKLGGNQSACGEYIGMWVAGSRGTQPIVPGAGGNAGGHVRLFR